MTTPLAELATRQAGVVSRSQLRGLALSDQQIKDAVAQSRLLRVHRSVYAVGHTALSLRGRWWAAVLACGPGAVLSHRAAGVLWEIHETARYDIDVTAPRRVRLEGITAHRNHLHPEDVTHHHGLPVTKPARTVIDLADVTSPRNVERAFDQARILHHVSLEAFAEAAERAEGRRTALVRQLVQQDAPSTLTDSELEELFPALIGDAGLPLPRTRMKVLGRRRDFVWPEQRLIVETDGGRFHSTRRRLRDDKRRDAEALAHGWKTLRFAYEDIVDDPEHVLAMVRSHL